MPSKKKKYNARFPALFCLSQCFISYRSRENRCCTKGCYHLDKKCSNKGRIKKIMQTDEEVGKVAQAVPVIISKALEMFIESLLKKSAQITLNRNAKTLTPSHMKQCILSENRFDFLKDLVKNVPDASAQEDQENNLIVEESNFYIKNESDSNSSSNESKDASYYPEQIPSSSSATTTGNRGAISRTPVIQYCPKNNEPRIRVGDVATPAPINFSVNNILNSSTQPPGSAASGDQRIQNSPLNFQMGAPLLAPVSNNSNTTVPKLADNVPPLIPISRMQPNQTEIVRTPPYYGQSTGDNLCIDEDYDN